jgi:cytochrome c2
MSAIGAALDWLRRKPAQAVILAIVLFIIELGVVDIGVVAEIHKVPERIVAKIQDALAGPVDENEQTVTWAQKFMNQNMVELASVRVGGFGRGGGLAEVDGAIVFSTPQGRINALSRDMKLSPLNLRAPLNLDKLHADPLMSDPLFEVVGVRVHDLFTREIKPGEWELFATFSRFVKAGCFEFVMARAHLNVKNGVVSAASPDWEDLYIARPGCIRYKDRSWRFVGEQAGGRMQMLDDHTMLISVGDHQFDGFNDAHNGPMDPEWDLGKIIAFDLNTREGRIYASGLRNPQGLTIMRDGRIFETEHGPQGGDEINLIRDGENYGWPLVTYGMNYGYPRRRWETDPAPGAHGGYSPGEHGGYARPLWAFVPSVGISNLVQPSADEFPRWRRNDLLVGSMRAGTLFHVHVEDTRAVYVEPLSFDGERLRDIISMTDGRIAILTDSGNIVFMRNAEKHKDEARSFTVSGFNSLAQDDSLPAEEAPAAKGKQMFGLACVSCHSLTGEAGIGPPLNGVIGRRVGGYAGYGYSAALTGQKAVWTEDSFTKFATDPQRYYPGTTMPATTISWTQLPNIAAYLSTTKADQ